MLDLIEFIDPNIRLLTTSDIQLAYVDSSINQNNIIGGEKTETE